MDGTTGTTKLLHFEELGKMENVIQVFELLDGENEPALRDLVTPYRQLVQFFDLFTSQMTTVAPGTQILPNKDEKAFQRLFLFRDVIILARFMSTSIGSIDDYSINRKLSHVSETLQSTSSFSSSSNNNPPRNETKSAGGKIWRLFSFRKTPKKSIDNSLSSATASPRESIDNGKGVKDYEKGYSFEQSLMDKMNQTQKGDLKFSHYFHLGQCSFKKLIDADQDGMLGVQVTFVENAHSSSKSKVEQINLWFENSNSRDIFISTIGALISASASVPQARLSGDRRNAFPKVEGYGSTLTKTLATHGSSDSTSSSPSIDTQKPVPFREVQSLNDLEDFYQVSFQTMVDAPADSKTEISVEFPNGPMGISLGSGSGVGVIVIRLASEGFAELAGVCVGDRVISIGDAVLGLGSNWQEALEHIKMKERPVVIKFERFPDICAKIEEAMMNEELERDPSTTAKWKKRYGNRMKSTRSINVLEDMTNESTAEKEKNESESERLANIFKRLSDRASSDEEKQCINVVKELLLTEKDYVNSLHTMVKEFLLPLRKATSKICCKDDEEGGKVCEHGLLRSTCNKEAKLNHLSCKSDDIKEIFMNTEVLLKVNSELYTTLIEGVIETAAKYPSMTVTEIVEALVPSFVKVLPFFVIYAHYCHQYPTATAKLRQLRQEKEVDEFIHQREMAAAIALRIETNTKIVTISSLLIKPVQRICKYPLLFNELLKAVQKMIEKWKEDGDATKRISKDLQPVLDKLKDAATQVQKIADNVNDKVHLREALASVVDIFEELGGGKDGNLDDLFVPSRRYLGSYEVLVRQVNETNQEKSTHKFYLFNDWIILAIPKLKRSTSVSARRKSFSLDISASSSAPSSSSSAKDGPKWTKICGIDLRHCEIKPLHEKDKSHEWFGFLIKSIERQHVEDKVTGTMKFATVIQKYEVWYQQEEDCNELLKKLKENIETLEHQKESEDLGKEKFGGSELNKKRSWKKKTSIVRHTSSFHGEEETTNPQALLSDLAHHYEVIGQTETHQ